MCLAHPATSITLTMTSYLCVLVAIRANLLNLTLHLAVLMVRHEAALLPLLTLLELKMLVTR